jgi:hypothetical protein
MKTISKLFVFLLMIALCIGCEKADDVQVIEPQETEDFYYVRFDVEAWYNIGNVEISLTGCNSFSTNTNESSFSEILGPAPKGAIAEISVGSGNSITSIHVSKNNGPFALKKQGSSSLSYTIDF